MEGRDIHIRPKGKPGTGAGSYWHPCKSTAKVASVARLAVANDVAVPEIE
jgi:hypothetical protein